MKRLVAAVLVAMLMLGASSALAAGKINVEQENFMTVKDYNDYAYAFAKVTNTGNKLIRVNAGILEVFDAEGDVITSTDNMYKYAEYLEPDEYTYVYIGAKLEEGQMANVDDYLLTITGKSESENRTKRLEVKDLSFKRGVQEGYSTYDYAYFTVVNNTDEVMWNVKVIYALLDDLGNILFVRTDSIDWNEGLAPGSSICYKENIDSDFMAYYDAHDLVPTKVDAIAFVNYN